MDSADSQQIALELEAFHTWKPHELPIRLQCGLDDDGVVETIDLVHVIDQIPQAG